MSQTRTTQELGASKKAWKKSATTTTTPIVVGSTWTRREGQHPHPMMKAREGDDDEDDTGGVRRDVLTEFINPLTGEVDSDDSGSGPSIPGLGGGD